MKSAISQLEQRLKQLIKSQDYNDQELSDLFERAESLQQLIKENEVEIQEIEAALTKLKENV